MRLHRLIAALAFSVIASVGLAASAPEQSTPTQGSDSAAAVPSYVPRFGRVRPIVAVVGENRFTELTDYVVPYGVLQASGVADVVALGTQAGPIQMFPALKVLPQATVAEFDARFPEGADYVIVPAVHHTDDAALLSWVASQAAKGATVVGVCDGVWVLANAGLLKGHKAVGHWYSFDELAQKFADTAWVKDRRYLADGKVVTTTGVSASIPVSLALVEAIGGRERAASVAHAMGAAGWSPVHKSSDFQLRTRHVITAAANWLSFWSHEDLGIPISTGVDDVALALAADAYSRTYRSEAFSVATSSAEVRTRSGLMIIPDRVGNDAKKLDRTITLTDRAKPVAALDAALQDITDTQGRSTSAFVALQMEYPQP